MPAKQPTKKRQRTKSPAAPRTSKSKTQKDSNSKNKNASTTLPPAGYLLNCDPPTKQYIKSLNELKTNDKKFIIEDLDATHLLIDGKLSVREEILQKVEMWMDANVFSNIEKVGENLET